MTIHVDQSVRDKMRHSSPAQISKVAIVTLLDALEEKESVLQTLVNKLDEIGANSEFNSVWTLHHVHGGEYHGPNWVDALARAREALAP